MSVSSLTTGQTQLAWEQRPSAFAEGVTLSHRLHYHGTCRVEEYTGTSTALVNAGVCTEEQLPPEHSVMRTYTPDGKRKKTGQPMEAGTLQIVRAGRRLFRCDRFIALTIPEQVHIKAERDRENQESLQRAQERQERERKIINNERDLSTYEIHVRMFEKMSNEHIDRCVQSRREWFLSEVNAANDVKAARRRAIAESDGVVVYPKVWKHE